MTDLCRHDLLPASCADCTGRGGTPPPDPSRYGVWFQARLPGPCAGPCEGRIEPGDMIRADGDGGYLCHRCGDQP